MARSTLEDSIDTRLTREQIAQRLDAVLGPEDAGNDWASVIPPGAIYSGKYDANGFTIRREQSFSSSALKWRASYADADGGTRVTIRNTSGLRSLLVWCIIGLLLPVVVMIVVVGGFKAGMLGTIVTLGLVLGIAASLLLMVLYALIARDENIDRRFLRKLLTITAEEAARESGR